MHSKMKKKTAASGANSSLRAKSATIAVHDRSIASNHTYACYPLPISRAHTRPPFSTHPPPLSWSPSTPVSCSFTRPTDMPPSRSQFRSLRSFTHAARHHIGPSEISSDPIVDDASPGKPHSPPTITRLNNHNFPTASRVVVPETPENIPHIMSSSDEAPVPAWRASSRVTSDAPPSASARHVINRRLNYRHMSPGLAHRNKSETAQELNRTRRRPYIPAPAFYTTRTDLRYHKQNRSESHPNSTPSTPLSPAAKRRRTRSNLNTAEELSSGPEVDDLQVRMIVDDATEEQRDAILAASGSSRGRRKLHQLFIHDESDEKPAGQSTLSAKRKPTKAEVEWLKTNYDESVEEVAPSPSPRSKRKRSSLRQGRLTSRERHQPDSSRLETSHIDTSESPTRIKRGRSRRSTGLQREKTKVAHSTQEPQIVDSSHSDEEKRRSTRLANTADVDHNEDDEETEDFSNSDYAGRAGRKRKTEKSRPGKGRKRLQRASASRPLPKPKKGLLQDRLRLRKPLYPLSKKASRNSHKNDLHETAEASSAKIDGLRRSSRIKDSRTEKSKNSVGIWKKRREVVEESPDDRDRSDADGLRGDSDVALYDIEDDESEDVMQFEGDDDENDDDEDDADHDAEFNSFEEQAWRAALSKRANRRSIKRKTSGRRKRTRPRDVFQRGGDLLTAREQRERLDFLVRQSEDIASHLHEAMAAVSRAPIPGTDAGSGKPAAPISELDSNKPPMNGEPSAVIEGKYTDTLDPQGNPEGNTRQKEIFVSPTGEGFELQPHQQEGVDWLLTLDAQGLNAILADEMGLGKTIQAISFLASLVLSGSRGPHLVIAPKNVCQHWADEVKQFYPNEIKVAIHQGTAELRFDELGHILHDDDFDILVTSFDLALRDLFSKKRRDGISWDHAQVLRAFRKVEFEYLIVDEAHRLKNDASKLNLGIRNYDRAQRRLLLTGTPLSNNLKELWCLMNVLNPRIFSSKATFENWFSAPFASKTKKKAKVSLTHAEQSVIVDRLHTVIRPFFRRRVRADVCPSYTSADEIIIRCPLSGLQRAVMLHLQRRASASEAGMNNVIMQMRNASNHPYIVSHSLFDDMEKDAAHRLVSSSGKFVFLYYALPRLIKSGHRVLIFSQFRRVLDFIEDLLDMLSLTFGRLDGLTSTEDRTYGLNEFNQDGSHIPVFLLTTRAGGVGLNLQSADTVILFDSDWNPSADLQAVSRIQRIGQKKTVHILRLVTENSVDNIIAEVARHKLRTQNVAVSAGKFNTSEVAALDTRMRQKDLEALLVKLEAQNYEEDPGVDDQAGAQDMSSPESIFPPLTDSPAQQSRISVWSRQLLRKGEKTLASVDKAPIWVASSSGPSGAGLPNWLDKEADLHAAAKALRCKDPCDAKRVYEEAVLSRAQNDASSKGDRSVRARRVVCLADFSDADSEGEGSDSIANDPDVNEEQLQSEHDSDLDISINEGCEGTNKAVKQAPSRSIVQGLTTHCSDQQVTGQMPIVPAGQIPIVPQVQGFGLPAGQMPIVPHVQGFGLPAGQMPIVPAGQMPIVSQVQRFRAPASPLHYRPVTIAPVAVLNSGSVSTVGNVNQAFPEGEGLFKKGVYAGMVNGSGYGHIFNANSQVRVGDLTHKTIESQRPNPSKTISPTGTIQGNTSRRLMNNEVVHIASSPESDEVKEVYELDRVHGGVGMLQVAKSSQGW